MGRSEDLFERIVQQGETAIEAFINDRQSEELYLDFKRSTDQGAGSKLHQNDRQNLGRAISGFGNSEGGVVVWGVDCRNLAVQGDVANAKFPIDNPKRFKSWLEGAVSGCAVPPHLTVRHEAIETAAGKGFVVTHVPMSYLAPHQCVHDVRYYMRAGSDFLPVPHAVLAGMFGRRPQASLIHKWSSGQYRFDPSRPPGNPRVLFDAYMNLYNLGRGIARDLYVNVETRSPGPESGIVALASSNQWIWERVANASLSAISQESFRLGPQGATQPLTLTFSLAQPFERLLTYKIAYGCSGSAPGFIEWTVQPSELDDILEWIAKAVPQRLPDLLPPKLVDLLLPKAA